MGGPVDGSLLRIEDLCVRFGAARTPGTESPGAVEGVSLELAAGEVLGLVGESGAGKSTVLRAAGRLLPADARVSGRVLFDGVDLLTAPESRLRELRGTLIATVFQHPGESLDPTMRVGRQFVELLRCHGSLRGAAARARVAELFDLVGLADPARVAAAYPFELSGGMQQRVALAMAMAFGPDLLLADEVTSALDAATQLQVARELRHLVRGSGTAMLFVTHNMALAYHLCDRIAVMVRGRVVEQGTAEDVCTRPASPEARALVAAVPHLGGGAGEGTAMPCGNRADASRADAGYDPMPLVELRGVGKSYRSGGRSVCAVEDVSLAVRPGESVALIGQSGAGKSTVARMAAGLERPGRGSVLWDGADLARMARAEMRRRRGLVQMVTQDPAASFDPRWTVGRTVREPLVRLGGVPRERADGAVAGLFEAVGLPVGLAGRLPGQLSGGQLQRVSLARALACRARLIVLDEATSALDTTVQEQILGLLEELRASQGLAYLFILHDLAVARRMCDRIAVMRAGGVVEQFASEACRPSGHTPYVEDLLAATLTLDQPKGAPLA